MISKRYDMPASFGPSTMPSATTVEDALAAIISFETDRDAIAALLPPQLTPAEQAIVSVASIAYPTTDYMGGRGYNEIVVSLSAVHEGSQESLSAGFAAVLWVDQFGALFAGREFQGLPKLLAEVSAPEPTGDGYRIGCTEYGAPLLKGEIGGLIPMPAERLDRIRQTSSAVPTFGWKYIPSASGEPDADYATVNYTRWEYEQVWSGDGKVEFFMPTASEAPFGSRPCAGLAALPILRWRPAFVGRGKVVIDRSMTRRL